eukprot:3473562-Pyramimonas_sp.AAC.1
MCAGCRGFLLLSPLYSLVYRPNLLTELLLLPRSARLCASLETHPEAAAGFSASTRAPPSRDRGQNAAG